MDVSEEQKRIEILLMHLLTGELNDKQRDELLKWSKEDPNAVQLYCDFISNYSLIKSQYANQVNNSSVDSQFDKAIWDAMVEDEKTAPAVNLVEEKPHQELIQKVIYQKKSRKISKLSLFFAVFSAAAVLLIVLFLKYTPAQYGVEVATLVDQMNAEWADSGIDFQKGDRLWTSQRSFCLDSGIVEIKYDNGVVTVIEGPAKFTVERSGFYFEYGRLFSSVPKSGLGFLVETPTTRVIDLGTEFGVQADVNGSSELHVIKGKVQLFAGPKEEIKSTLIVNEDKAVRYNANSSQIDDIPIARQGFVRAINSQTQQVWRGETSLSLASIAAGHNGFQQVDSLVGLNPDNGEFKTSVVQKNRKSNGMYNSVTDSDFIDGVFVPDGGVEQAFISVSSMGHTFKCPNTSGIFTHEIAAYKGPVGNQHTTIPPAMINGQEIVNDSVLVLHSNAGITFDLQAIRESLPQLDLKNLKATGLPMKEYNPDIDFWILVDGQIKYEKKIVADDREPISLNIEFSPQDRFLTLIVTDGLRATDDERKNPCSSDFFYMIDPELNLQERQ